MTDYNIENSDPATVFAGGWGANADAGAHNGTTYLTAGAGDTATVTFHGTGITFYAITQSNMGEFSAAIDGGSPTTVDEYSASHLEQQPVWTVSGLTDGPHTLVITCLGTMGAGSGTWTYYDYCAVVEPGEVVTGVPATSDGAAIPGGIFGGFGVTVSGVPAESDGAAPAGVTKVIVPGPVAQSHGVALAGVIHYGERIHGPAAESVGAALTGRVTGNVVVGVPAISVGRALPGSLISVGSTVSGPVASSEGGAPSGGIYTGPYIENFCPNPSFEVDLTGYGELTGTVITQVGTNAAYGHHSMQVVTNGLASGEGVSTPLVTYLTETINGSAGVDLSGAAGTLVVSAYSNPGGVLLGSKTVLITPAWKRVILNDLDLFGGDEFFLVIRTPFAQHLTFLVDAVQYEENSPASMYIDGDQPGCEWV
jgi:hypothetical protein